jgi:GNAT superfamily N-acetyltransferase
MTAMRLAGPDDLDRLMPMVEAFHREMGISTDPADREEALLPLLKGSPFGMIYLVGLDRAPMGYAIVTISWAVEFGGMDAFLDEFWVRPAVRGRGIGTDILTRLPQALGEHGIKAIHLEVDRADEASRRLYNRAKFEDRDRYMLMTRRL